MIKEFDRRESICHLRRAILNHFGELGLSTCERDSPCEFHSKESIRRLHAFQRADNARREFQALERHFSKTMPFFADGSEILPEKISPVLIPVESDRWTGHLFRTATLLWSVPVSRGFGRRMRFLILDGYNGKLIGVLALGDPVFNLRARDQWIGWTTRDREQRLVNVMDGFIVGAVPPYTKLLGGKLVASLIASQEVSDHFTQRYGASTGIISGERKHAQLALVTITSALGRSSIYNRLKLPNLIELHRIGQTNGWGHFQVPEAIFRDMRQLLDRDGHRYASGHAYGQGPNWRIRVIREALKQVGLDPSMLRHGISREVYALPLDPKWREYLLGECNTIIGTRPSVSAIADACRERWIIPRSRRVNEYRYWRREDTLSLITDFRADSPSDFMRDTQPLQQHRLDL